MAPGRRRRVLLRMYDTTLGFARRSRPGLVVRAGAASLYLFVRGAVSICPGWASNAIMQGHLSPPAYASLL